MVFSDFHMHTTHCDGNATVEEMVLSAINKGMTCIGISGHGHTPFDTSYCMSRENTEKYMRDVLLCREKYEDKIRVFLGIEQDYFAGKPIIDVDYTIGSVHYLHPEEDIYIPIDISIDILRDAVQRYYGGDIYAAAESYFRCVGDLVEATDADIIGHFDLFTKFAECGHVIDTENARYQRAWMDAVDRLLPYGKPFEVNTGAMSRGYRTSPYPALQIASDIAKKGGSFIFSSDSHSYSGIGYAFAEIEDAYRALGATVLDIPSLKTH